MEKARNAHLRIGPLDLGLGLILAPMAGVTDLSHRLVARSLGADLVTSEMVSAEGIVRRNASTRGLLQSRPEERPLAIQLFGGEPGVMAEAAGMVADLGADLIDLNMGCPVGKVLRQGAGAALLKDEKKLVRIVVAVRQAVGIPVTVKIRSGWSKSEINAVEVARRAEEAGADALTIHPRTVRQGFSGEADWSQIAKVKQAVKVAVIGNGDVKTPEQVQELKSLTGCDGVMIGRGAVGNPWIFQQARQLAVGDRPYHPGPLDRLQVMLRHLRLYEECTPGRTPLAAARSRLMWYSRGLAGSSQLRRRLCNCRSLDAMVRICEEFFQRLASS